MTKQQSKKTKQEKGFSALIGVIIVVILGLGAAVGYYFYDQSTEVDTENSNMAKVENTNITANTNTVLPVNTKTCDYDTDCEVRVGCSLVDCYNVDAEEVDNDCVNFVDPDLDNKSCVCAEKECAVVEAEAEEETDETADWETYSNADHAYSIQYSSTWSVSDDSYEDKVQLEPQDGVGPNIIVQLVSEIEDDELVSNISTTTINGVTVQRQSESGIADLEAAYFPMDENYIKVWWTSIYEGDYSEYETILSTFQFTD